VLLRAAVPPKVHLRGLPDFLERFALPDPDHGLLEFLLIDEGAVAAVSGEQSVGFNEFLPMLSHQPAELTFVLEQQLAALVKPLAE